MSSVREISLLETAKNNNEHISGLNAFRRKSSMHECLNEKLELLPQKTLKSIGVEHVI